MEDIFLADTEQKLRTCFVVMQQLRPHLDCERFLQQVSEQYAQGYNLVGLRTDDTVVAVAGYRVSLCLAWGRFMYVDDLVTDELHRSKGYGKTLLHWLMDEARNQDCRELHLDSGTQRKDAHRFYEREGMQFMGHHYAITLTD